MVNFCVLRITLLVSPSVVSAIASEITICSCRDGASDSSTPHRRRSGKNTEAPPPLATTVWIQGQRGPDLRRKRK